MDFGEVVKSRPHGHFQKSAPMLHTVSRVLLTRVMVKLEFRNGQKVYKKLSYCWETVRRESMPRIAEMDVEMTT